MKSLYEVIAEIIPAPDLFPKIKPLVLEKGVNPYSDDVMLKLNGYIDRATTIRDFQGMTSLIDIAINELSLHPVNDREKLAMVFNKYRVERGLPAL